MAELIALFCKTFRDDFDRISVLFDSIRLYNEDRIPVCISMPPEDISIFMDLFSRYDFEVFSDDSLVGFGQGSGDGWTHQQVVKLCCDQTHIADSYFVIDSDYYFIRPFYRSDFVSASGLPMTCISRFGHSGSSRHIDLVIAYLNSDTDVDFTADEVSVLRSGVMPDLLRPFSELSSLCDGTDDLSRIFSRNKVPFFCQPGPILRADVLELIRTQALLNNKPDVVGHLPAVLVNICPWEYSWHAEYLLASSLEISLRPLPVIVFPTKESVIDARSRGLDTKLLSKKYLAINMAARHHDIIML
jgi:hypothetical protein